ncbi:uncharacterized protein LOC5517328 [Nematostella vectensis]|uniref:uncharacterized protein LOC5517328 n=1 Tax=Nematostella vectensis TaxID=45351 RepID=UPI002076F710|nr:uncharacterized protein LOC5517328 [Nematostella vectensis]
MAEYHVNFKESDETDRSKRLNANLIERRRMQNINSGFATLKKLLPPSERKQTKAAILQQASQHIVRLQRAILQVKNENELLRHRLATSPGPQGSHYSLNTGRRVFHQDAPAASAKTTCAPQADMRYSVELSPPTETNACGHVDQACRSFHGNLPLPVLAPRELTNPQSKPHAQHMHAETSFVGAEASLSLAGAEMPYEHAHQGGLLTPPFTPPPHHQPRGTGMIKSQSYTYGLSMPHSENPDVRRSPYKKAAVTLFNSPCQFEPDMSRMWSASNDRKACPKGVKNKLFARLESETHAREGIQCSDGNLDCLLTAISIVEET